MSSLKFHRFVTSGSRLILQSKLTKNKNCFPTKSSWNWNITNVRGMCTNSHIDPECKQSLHVFHPKKGVLVTRYVGQATRAMCTSTNSPIDPECKQPLFHPKKGDLVYVGQATRHCFYVKALSLASCTFGICIQPYLYMNAQSFSLPLMVALVGSVSFFTIITTALIQFMTKKYVTDIYYNKNMRKFTAARWSFFLQRKEMEYTIDDVEVPPFSGMFSTMKIKGKPYFIDENNFKDVEIFMHMVGYDKPIDLKKYPTEKKE